MQIENQKELCMIIESRLGAVKDMLGGSYNSALMYTTIDGELKHRPGGAAALERAFAALVAIMPEYIEALKKTELTPEEWKEIKLGRAFS